MPCTFEDVEGDRPWLVVALSLVSFSRLPTDLSWIGLLGFIGWDDESS